MQISVVVPIHDEEGNIEPLVREIVTTLEGPFDYEIIYVDDGSTDGSRGELRALCREVPRLHAIGLRCRSGQSTALRVGVAAATAPWIVTLDGDGQNDPADIPRLLETLEALSGTSAVQMVAGIRRQRHDSWLRRFSSRVANTIRGTVLGDNMPDTGCGLKLLKRDAFLALPFFDHFHRFLPALILRNGGQAATVEVTHRPRRRGVSKYGVHNRLWVGIVDLVGVFWLLRRGKIPDIEEELT